MAENIMRIATGFWMSKTLHAAAELGVADVLHKLGGQATTEEIVAHIPEVSDPRVLFRVLRALASIGIFTMELHGSPDDTAYHQTYKFGLNETSQLMRSDIPHSMRSSILLEAGDLHYNIWSGFLGTVKTGQPAVKATVGADSVWEYNEKNPKQRQIFNDAMTNITNKEIHEILAHYDFSGISSIVDIGGGLGSLLFSILRKYPDIKKGYLFDLPSVVQDVVVPDDLKDRVEVHGGSFLAEQTGIPKGADAYIMKHIIHDWNDEKSEVILKATRQAMPDHARVILAEYEVPLTPPPCLAKMLDLHMMTVCGAKERTRAEYAALFRKAGLELSSVVGHDGSINVIEARSAH